MKLVKTTAVPIAPLNSLLEKLTLLSQESCQKHPVPSILQPLPASKTKEEAESEPETPKLQTDKHKPFEMISYGPLDIGLQRQRMIATKMARTIMKHGKVQDHVIARIIGRLSVKYGRPDCLALAVDAIRPVIKYHKDQVHRKQFYPMGLPEESSIGIGIRWLLGAARNKQYHLTDGIRRHDLERSVHEEIEAVLAGTSSLYAKKFQFHRNPNQ